MHKDLESPENEEIASNTIMSENNNDLKDSTNETESQDEKQSVRRLSLFDTLTDENNESSNSFNSEKIVSKTEPVLDKEENLVEEETQEFDSDEFNPEDEISEDELNQENEEELLDIPTFLRRQAN